MGLISKSLRALKIPSTLLCLQLLFVVDLLTTTTTSIAPLQWLAPLTEHDQLDPQGVWYFAPHPPPDLQNSISKKD